MSTAATKERSVSQLTEETNSDILQELGTHINLRKKIMQTQGLLPRQNSRTFNS